jgi:hypothetical protein
MKIARAAFVGATHVVAQGRHKACTYERLRQFSFVVRAERFEGLYGNPLAFRLGGPHSFFSALPGRLSLPICAKEVGEGTSTPEWRSPSAQTRTRLWARHLRCKCAERPGAR